MTADAYAQTLLADLGAAPLRPLACADEHPAYAWARSGLMALTGDADAAPLICPVPLATCADGALAAFASLAPAGAFDDLRGAQLLGERAAIAAYARRGRTSPGGMCRLLDTADGAIALNLARDDDWALLPAWLEADVAPDWDVLAEAVRRRTMHDCVERGRDIGLAVAPVAPPWSKSVTWVRAAPVLTDHLPCGSGFGPTADPACRPEGRPKQDPSVPGRRCRVLDLSSLWAGPLCSHLLQRCGADVVKLESTQRPDGARNGPRAFFDLLSAGKRSVALDFGSPQGRAQLRALIERADIVVEASRPRALRQLGIDAEALVKEREGLTWVSLTGYGRREPYAQWIAYGDDAGVAAGLSYLMRQIHGRPMFVGDAIADPLAGLHAALAAWASHRAGGSRVLDIALVDVLRQCIAADAPQGDQGWRQRAAAWRMRIAGQDIAAPRARQPTAIASALGADTGAVLADWAIAC